MSRWIEENKIATIIIIILMIVLVIVYFDKQPEEINKTNTSEIVKEKLNLDGNVLSFDSLDQVEKFADLSKWGLVASGQYNHTSGKNLILLAIKATSFFQGDWVAAHGLLGVNMINVDVLDRIGYQSLFLSSFATQGFKMYASSLMDDMALLVDFDGSIKPIKSIIARREAAIYSLSRGFEGRYIFSDAGSFGRNYFPEPSRISNAELKKALIDGLKIYNELLKEGFKDKTLKDSLGMAWASLDYDSVNISDTDVYKLGPLQVYTDALKATLVKLNKKKNHSYNILYELGWEMQARGLAFNDEILLPEDDSNFQAMLKIFEDDLDAIEVLIIVK